MFEYLYCYILYIFGCRRLILYPNGNARRGGGGHISLYLAIEKTDSLPLGWEANVTYKMFVFDHNKDRYLTIQGVCIEKFAIVTLTFLFN